MNNEISCPLDLQKIKTFKNYIEDYEMLMG